MRAAVVLGLLCLAPALSRADEVYTRSGGHLTGEVVERDERHIVVDIGLGRVELPLSYVERIEPGEAPITVYRRRAQALSGDDTGGWLDLARWARDHDLGSQADEAFHRVVEVDPDNAAAQQALGHVRLGERWMTPAESYAAQGLISFEGRWVRPEERELALAERAAVAERARQEADTQARVRETEARLREAEARAKAAEAEVRVVEAEAKTAERQSDAFPFPFPIVAGFTPSFGLSPVSPIITVFNRAPEIGRAEAVMLHAGGHRGDRRNGVRGHGRETRGDRAGDRPRVREHTTEPREAPLCDDPSGVRTRRATCG